MSSSSDLSTTASTTNADDAVVENGKARERRRPEDLSPEAWLLKIAKEQPELIDEKDVEYLGSIAPSSVLAACFERFIPMIWNKVLYPGHSRRKDTPRASLKARARQSGEAAIQAYIDMQWMHYRRMTGEQARSEAGGLVAIFTIVKARQLVENAMTREQFGKKFMGLHAA